MAVANLQSEVVRSEQMVRVAEQNALAGAESARGEGNAPKVRADGHAASVCVTGEADAAAIRAAKARRTDSASRPSVRPATPPCRSRPSWAENKVKVAPDIASPATLRPDLWT
jgi:hypothetical protein